MLLYSSLLYVLSWVLVTLSLALVSFILFSYILFTGAEVVVSWGLFSFPLVDLVASVRLDAWSACFSVVVLLITSVVFAFSYYYLQSSLKLTYFIWLTFFFVLSMLILINFDDLFFVMLGWDGLGVVSFFLIIFYQSPVSLFSGAFTFFINRVGDGLFIASLVLFAYSSGFMGYYSTPLMSGVALLFLLALMTKSALFPFSPWLPAAMAAPTPISSLVHSSTLVTAGLYLMLRHTPVFHSEHAYSVCAILLVIGVFTSFYAGLSSVFEVDLKKVVALSTLSHLGFIATALGLGWESLAFFHLIAHALFKSSLFMAVGSYIVSACHMQDSRYLSSFSVMMPFSSSVVLLSEGSLLGFPFLSGFYSKDYVLEVFHYSHFSGFVCFILLVNVIFTFYYSFRVVGAVVGGPLLAPYLPLPFSASKVFVFLLSFLSSCSVGFGVIWSFVVDPVFILVPSLFNSVPVLLLMLVASWFFISPSAFSLSSFFGLFTVTMFSYMSFLVNFWSSFLGNLFVRWGVFLNKTLEYGALYHYVVSLPYFSLLNLVSIFGYLVVSRVSLGFLVSLFLLVSVIFVTWA